MASSSFPPAPAGGAAPIHLVSEDDQNRGNGWLGTVPNPLQRLGRFLGRGKDKHQGPAAETDDRLAALAAAVILPRQMRVFPESGWAVAVIGCGQMGCNIAGEFLRRGCAVKAHDQTEFARGRAMDMVMGCLNKHVELGLLLPWDVPYLMSRFTVHASIPEAFEGTTVAIEAITESLDAKVGIFRALANAGRKMAINPRHVVFATNTLNVPLKDIAYGVARDDPEFAARITGVRFLDPTWFVDDVELTTCDPRFVDQASVDVCSLLQQRLFKPAYGAPGMPPRHLTAHEATLYHVRQRTQCTNDASAYPVMPSAIPLSTSPSTSQTSKSSNDETLCIVCNERVCNMVFQPCGHLSTCAACTHDLIQKACRNCPVCRQKIEDVLPLEQPPAQ